MRHKQQKLSKELLEIIPDFVDVTKLPKGFVFLNPAWDPNDSTAKYRNEINKVIRRFQNTVKHFKRHENDIRQAVDLALWQASKLYEDDMNEGLAYTIARNTAASYIKNLVRRPNGVINIPKEVIFTEQPLEQVNEHDEEFIPAEVENAYATSQEEMRKATYEAQKLERRKKTLRTLKNKWSGSKRKVAEAMLAGKSMADVPGVPRSSAFKIKAAITAEVEAQAQHKARDRK